MFLSLPWGHRQSEPKFSLIIPVIDICTHIRMQQYVLLAGGALAGQRKQECRLDFRPWRLEWIVKTGEGTRAGPLLWLLLPCLESSRQVAGAATLCLLRESMNDGSSWAAGSKFTIVFRKKFRFSQLKSRNMNCRKYASFSLFPINNKLLTALPHYLQNCSEAVIAVHKMNVQ